MKIRLFLIIPIAAIFIHSLSISFLNYSNILFISLTYVSWVLSLPVSLHPSLLHQTLASNLTFKGIAGWSQLTIPKDYCLLFMRLQYSLVHFNKYFPHSLKLLMCLSPANMTKVHPIATLCLQGLPKETVKMLQLRSLPIMLNNICFCTTLSFGMINKWPIFCWNWKLTELGMVFIFRVCVECSTTQACYVTNGSRH